MTIAEKFMECIGAIRKLSDSPQKDYLTKKCMKLIKGNAVSITKDLFNKRRRHYTFIDGSVLSVHKDTYTNSQPTYERKQND
jgi:hypothetical protein